MWYVIQTITGKEQELVDMIKQIMKKKKKKYQRCFVIYQECAYRVHGAPEFHIEPLFPSYVFVETDTPEEFFLELKRVPRMSKILRTDGYFWSIYKEEEKFLQNIIEGNKKEAAALEYYLIYPSLVQVDKEGKIINAEGFLSCYIDKIVKQRLRKRSVVLEIPFGGKKKKVRLGIRLEGDDMNHENQKFLELSKGEF